MPRLMDRPSLVLTVIVAAGLEGLTVVTSIYWPLFSLFVVLVTLGTILMLWHDVRARGPHVLILPLAYVGSVLLFHLYVSQGAFQQVFIALATLGFFFLVGRGVEWAYPTWNWFFTSGTFFLFTAGVYGLYFHLRFPLWAVVTMVGFITFLLAIHVLGRAPLSPAQRIFWSILLTIVMSELLGALALLPVSYLVVSGVLFAAFYVALHLLQRYLYERLTPTLVGEYLLLGSVAIGLILGTAHWSVL